MTALVLVAVFGSLGAVTRFLVDGAVRGRWSSRLPAATIAINISGSFVLGFLTGLAIYHSASALLLDALGTGFCGGYTTFSTAAVETVRLAQQRHYGAALVNGVGTVGCTVAAAALGILIAHPG